MVFLDYQAGELSSITGVTLFTAPYKCLFFAYVEGVSNDFDTGASYTVTFNSRTNGSIPTSVNVNSDSTYTTNPFLLVNGDTVQLNINGTTVIKYGYVRLPESV